MRIDKLVKMSQNREAWRKLVVMYIDPQPPN